MVSRPSAPPFRAEHLGSLLRPQRLIEAREAWENGRGNKEELRKFEKAAVKEIVQTQLDLGFRAANDGEYFRQTFWGPFFLSLEGFSQIGVPPDSYRQYMPETAALIEHFGSLPTNNVLCTGKIKHKGSAYLETWEYLKSLVTQSQWKNLKITIPGPPSNHIRYKEGKAYAEGVYASDDEYFTDVAQAYVEELNILYRYGLRNVQIDDPNLAAFCAEGTLARWKEDPLNSMTPDELLDRYIHTYNTFLAKIPVDMHIGLHICRGNFISSKEFSDGGYNRIAIKVFRELNVHTYYLEYDTPRAGSFEPLEYLPKNKSVILGAISTKFARLEDEAEIIQRVKDAARHISKGTGETEEESLNQLGVSPQCGFASHMKSNPVTHEDMVNKLKLVRSIADKLWPEEP